jgi:DNA helicase IV
VPADNERPTGLHLVPVDRDPVLSEEQAYLAKARDALRRMREYAQSLSADTAADRVSWRVLKNLLDQRVTALADHADAPLFFGRLDHDDQQHADLPETLYVGRRHVHDEEGVPLVIDWRAPASRAFYQAGPKEPMGVVRRRRFGYSGGSLTAYEDEPMDGRELQPSWILAEEIQRPRTGPMRDIVATIQPDQDELVRAELSQTVCIQGAPGTGKTAVGLHRAAYLLFTHREKLSRSGVLIVGPNLTFLSYIAAVLPALGEARISQATVADLLGDHLATERPPAAAIKGDERMVTVLSNALWAHIAKPGEGLLVAHGTRRYRIPDYEIEEMVASLRGTMRFGNGREALAQRLAHLVLVQMEQRGEAPDDRIRDVVARSKPVKQLLNKVWPKLTPPQVLFRLLSDVEFLARSAEGILSDAEQTELLWAKPYRSHRSAKWTSADAALLDELADLIQRTPSLGHLVIDEAQDLSAMELRALGRRCSTGSATVLGDLAQGTTPWSARSWEEVLRHLDRRGEVAELTLGFRVPREILDYAVRLLPQIAPGLAAPRSLRSGAGSLSVRSVPELFPAALEACRQALTREGSIGLIAADRMIPALAAALGAAELEHGVLGPDSNDSDRLVLIPASLAKGLEYDHVIVAEPAEIVSAEERGLARLYVCLTRAVTSLTVLHTTPLPHALSASTV